MPSTHRGHSSKMNYYTPSSTNLFVRYLPREVDDDGLRELFSPYGSITSSMVMRDIHSGHSIGTAFVRFSKHAEAVRALAGVHGMPLLGKTVAVMWAKQQHDDTPAGQQRLKMNKLFLRNVPVDVTEDDLVCAVRACGSVLRVSLHSDTTPVEEPSRVRRIAFVTFAEAGAAEAALRLLHHTCPFRSCCGVPLMGKLSEDYRQKARGVPLNVTPRGSECWRTPRSAAGAAAGAAAAVDTPRSLCSVATPGRGVYSHCSDSMTCAVLSVESAELDGELAMSASQYCCSGGDYALACRSRLYTPVAPCVLVAPELSLYRHNPYDAACVWVMPEE